MPLDGDKAESYQARVAPRSLYLAQIESIFWCPTFVPVVVRLVQTLLIDDAKAEAISEALLGSATVVGADGAFVVVGALVVTGATVVGAGVVTGTVVSGMVVSGSVVSGMVASGTVVSTTVAAGAVVSTACVSTGPVLEQAASERTMMVEIAAFVSRVFIL